MHSQSTALTTEISHYRNLAIRSTETVNKYNSLHGEPYIRGDRPFLTIVAEAEDILEKVYTSTLTPEDFGNPSEIGPQQFITNILTHEEIMIGREGRRISLEEYLRGEYRELIDNGFSISLVTQDVDRVLSYLSQKGGWSNENIDRYPSLYKEFLKKFGLTKEIVDSMREQKDEIPVLLVTTPSGEEYRIPILNNYVYLNEKGYSGEFWYIVNPLGNLIHGVISLTADDFISTTGNSRFISGLQTILHEIRHVMFAISQTSLYADQYEETQTLLRQANDILSKAMVMAVKTNSDVIGTIFKYESLISMSKDPLEIYELSQELDKKKSEAVASAFGPDSEENRNYNNVANKFKDANSQLLLEKRRDDILDTFVTEGLARRSQERFLRILGDNLVTSELTREEIEPLAEFVRLHNVVVNDALSGLTLYGAGYYLVPDIDGYSDMKGATISILQRKAVDKAIIDDPTILIDAISYYATSASEYDLFLNPPKDSSEAVRRRENTIWALFEDGHVVDFFTLRNSPQFIHQYLSFDIMTPSERETAIRVLENEAKSSVTDHSEQTERWYFHRLLIGKYVVNPMRSEIERALSGDYDFSGANQKIVDSIRSNAPD